MFGAIKGKTATLSNQTQNFMLRTQEVLLPCTRILVRQCCLTLAVHQITDLRNQTLTGGDNGQEVLSSFFKDSSGDGSHYIKHWLPHKKSIKTLKLG